MRNMLTTVNLRDHYNKHGTVITREEMRERGG